MTTLKAIAIRLGRMGLSVLYAGLKLLPLQRKIVMISREPAAGPDDFLAVQRSILRLDPAARIVMYVRPVPSGILRKVGFAFTFLAQLFHIATARVLVVERYSLLVSGLHHRNELTIIQLWHALGAFKKVGLSVLGQAEGHDPRVANAMRMHAGYDIALISGEACRPAFAEAFGMPADELVVCPLPRVDRLRDPAIAQDTRERILTAHPHLRGRRVALYAPTFRADGQVPVDAAELAGELERIGVRLVVKLHPLMDRSFAAGTDTAPGFTTQEMLSIADLFITDYSSALFEAAVVGLPSYFLAPDLDEYLATRDFYLDYRHELPGPIVRSIGELVDAVEAGSAMREDAAAFCSRWVQVPDNAAATAGATPCADRIARIVLDGVSGAAHGGLVAAA